MATISGTLNPLERPQVLKFGLGLCKSWPRTVSLPHIFLFPMIAGIGMGIGEEIGWECNKLSFRSYHRRWESRGKPAQIRNDTIFWNWRRWQEHGLWLEWGQQFGLRLEWRRLPFEVGKPRDGGVLPVEEGRTAGDRLHALKRAPLPPLNQDASQSTTYKRRIQYSKILEKTENYSHTSLDPYLYTIGETRCRIINPTTGSLYQPV